MRQNRCSLAWESTACRSRRNDRTHIRDRVFCDSSLPRQIPVDGGRACSSRSIPRTRYESDSATLVKILNSKLQNSELYGIATDIFSLASYFELIFFVWIPRERNFVADGLAKYVLSVELTINVSPNFG